MHALSFTTPQLPSSPSAFAYDADTRDHLREIFEQDAAIAQRYKTASLTAAVGPGSPVRGGASTTTTSFSENGGGLITKLQKEQRQLIASVGSMATTHHQQEEDDVTSLSPRSTSPPRGIGAAGAQLVAVSPTHSIGVGSHHRGSGSSPLHGAHSVARVQSFGSATTSSSASSSFRKLKTHGHPLQPSPTSSSHRSVDALPQIGPVDLEAELRADCQKTTEEHQDEWRSFWHSAGRASDIARKPARKSTFGSRSSFRLTTTSSKSIVAASSGSRGESEKSPIEELIEVGSFVYVPRNKLGTTGPLQSCMQAFVGGGGSSTNGGGTSSTSPLLLSNATASRAATTGGALGARSLRQHLIKQAAEARAMEELENAVAAGELHPSHRFLCFENRKDFAKPTRFECHAFQPPVQRSLERTLQSSSPERLQQKRDRGDLHRSPHYPKPPSERRKQRLLDEGEAIEILAKPTVEVVVSDPSSALLPPPSVWTPQKPGRGDAKGNTIRSEGAGSERVESTEEGTQQQHPQSSPRKQDSEQVRQWKRKFGIEKDGEIIPTPPRFVR